MECGNCGECCGPVMISPSEFTRIKRSLDKNPGVREEITGKPAELTCIFLTELNSDKRRFCLIYEARPKQCKAYKCQQPYDYGWSKSGEWLNVLFAASADRRKEYLDLYEELPFSSEKKDFIAKMRSRFKNELPRMEAKKKRKKKRKK